MKKINKKLLILVSVLLLSVSFAGTAKAQLFWVGFNGSAVHSWFRSPKLNNDLTSDGWGWDFGFFLRYGKRPFVQAGFDWTWSQNTIYLKDVDFSMQETIKFNNFDFSLKTGYELYQSPMFKVKISAGPFIGTALMFSGDYLYFSKDDFRNPQLGVVAGTGFQFTNLVVDLEYRYHFKDLFMPVDIDGKTYKLDSNLQMLMLKVGIMF